MPTFIRAVLCLGFFFLGPIPLWAKPMYITDRIEVGVRSGTGIEQRIIGMVKSGDQVEWLEGDKNWSKIMMADKTVGWIATRFLVDQVKPSSLPNPILQEELKGLKEKNQILSRENEQLGQDKRKLSEEVKRLGLALEQEKSAQPTAELTGLKTKNEELIKEIVQYKKQIADSNPKGTNLPTEDKLKWFFAGSVVLCLGIILGWLFNRSRRKPKRYY